MGKPDKQQERTERYHKEFAAQLIEQVKKGTAPWQKPWKVGERIGPRNLASDRPYSGSNTLRLMAVASDRGYSDSRWATYGQIQAAGDRIRKGERGTPILSFKTHRRVAVRDEKGQARQGQQRGAGLQARETGPAFHPHLYRLQRRAGAQSQA